MNLYHTDIITTASDVFWGGTGEIPTDIMPKPLLVVIPELAHDSAEKALLTRMLEACALTPEKFNLITITARRPVSWFAIRELLAPRIIFLAGVSPHQLGINALFVLHAPNNFDGAVWLPSLPLAEVERNQAAKSQLWNNALRPVVKENLYGYL